MLSPKQFSSLRQEQLRAKLTFARVAEHAVRLPRRLELLVCNRFRFVALMTICSQHPLDATKKSGDFQVWGRTRMPLARQALVGLLKSGIVNILTSDSPDSSGTL